MIARHISMIAGINNLCILRLPRTVQCVQDLRDIVIEALKDGPKTGSEVAHDWAARAISEAFPCRHSANQ